MKKLIHVLLAVVVVVVLSRSASASGEIEIRDAKREDGRLTMTVSTPGGPLLTPDRFDVEVNDLRAEGLAATPESRYRAPGGVVLVIDVSGSMKGAPIRHAKQAVASFTRKVEPSTRLALIAFSDRAVLVSGFTADRSRVLHDVRRLPAKGETALYDAITRAAELVRGRPLEQRNIVLLSDGADTTSGRSLETAMTAATQVDATIFGVALRSPEFSDRSISALVDSTGGTLLQTSNSSKLSGLFDDLAKTLVTSYVVSVADPDPAAHRLRVKVAVDEGPKRATGSRTFEFDSGAAKAARGGTPRRLIGDIPLPLVLLVVFGAVAVLMFLASEFMRARRESMAERVAWYVDEHGNEQIDSDALISAAVLRRAQDVATQLATRSGHLQRIERHLEIAGMRWRPGEVIVASAALGLVGGVFGTVISGPFLGLVLFVAGCAGLWLTIKVKASKRRRAFSDQLPDVLMLMSGALKAGYSLQQAVGAVGQDAKPPASEEFRRIMAEVRLGGSLDDALKALSGRMGFVDLDWTVLAMQIQREVGGNLAEILETITGTIRERERIRRQLKALTAEGRLSALVLGLLPFGLGGFLAMANPEYVSTLFTSPIGWLMVGGSLVMMTIGFVWMRKIIRIEV